MLPKLFVNFIHYYEARGKDELRSFLTTLLAGFVVTFGYFVVEMDISGTIYSPEVIDWAIFGRDVLDAVVRSVLSGLMFAILGSKWPIRSSKTK